MFICDQCHKPIDPSNVQHNVFDHRIFILCAACHEQLRNIIKPALALHQLSRRN